MMIYNNIILKALFGSAEQIKSLVLCLSWVFRGTELRISINSALFSMIFFLEKLHISYFGVILGIL